jgi:hypothetical protein
MTTQATTASVAIEPLDAIHSAAARAAAFISGLGGRLTATGLGVAPSPRNEELARNAPQWLRQKLADRSAGEESKKDAVATYLHLKSADFRDIEDKRNDLMWAHGGLTDVEQLLRLNPVAASSEELRTALVSRYNDSIDTLMAGGNTINPKDKLHGGQSFEELTRQAQLVLGNLNKRLSELNGCYDRSVEAVRALLAK